LEALLVKDFWNHHPELHAQRDEVAEKAKTEFLQLLV
jgi:hypothetical protein